MLRTFISTIAAAFTISAVNAADIYYEIFVRSYKDSKGDGRGDLKGITSQLHYISELGATGIWLTPIFKSPSSHGYDAIDFRSIEPKIGTMEDFKDLISEAHRQGLKVILDIAVNHTSDQHPWFISASQGQNSPLRNRYVWRKDDPHWKFGGRWTKLGDEFYFSQFTSGLPDLNWKDAAVLPEVKSILHFWSQLGVDGYRLDAVRYYIEGPNGEPDTPETHSIINAFISDLKNDFPHSVFVGEVWADTKTIGTYVNSKKELDLAFLFPVAFAIADSINSRSGVTFQNALQKSLEQIKDPSTFAPFLTNHDMERIASVLDHDPEKLRLAAEILFALPGTPFLYYGEEIGMGYEKDHQELKRPPDEMERRPMLWNDQAGHGFTEANVSPWEPFSDLPPEGSVETQMANKNSLYWHYKNLIRLRKENPDLSGSQIQLLQTDQPDVVALLRSNTLVIINFASKEVSALAVSVPETVSGATKNIIWGSAKIADSENGKKLLIQNLLPCHSVFIRMK